LSDQELAEILKGDWERAKVLSRLDCAESDLDGLLPTKTMSIARRTVAKYREAMNIQSSSRRRRTF
jgi:DNA-directed RNA polymerase specialized sigma54-like protein